MRPAFSVIFLTTLIGAAQGLFIAVYVAADVRFVVDGSYVSAALAGLGLVASFFHLGRPSRAWRSAAVLPSSNRRSKTTCGLFSIGSGAFGPCHEIVSR